MSPKVKRYVLGVGDEVPQGLMEALAPSRPERVLHSYVEWGRIYLWTAEWDDE